MKKHILKHKYLLLLAVIFGAIFSAGATLVALLLKNIIDIAISKDINQFVNLVILTAIYLIILGLCYGIYASQSKKFICKIAKSLREDVFCGLFNKNIPDFKSVNSADYLSALTNDIKNLEDNYFNQLLLCLQNIIAFVTSFIIMLFLSPIVLLCLFLVIILLIIMPSFFQKHIQNKQNNFSKQQSEFTISIKDFLSGFEVIRSYRMFGYIAKAFDRKNTTVYSSKYALDKILAIVEALSTILGVFVQCSVLFMSAYLIIKGDITAGTLVGLVQVSGSIVVPIQVLLQSIPVIQGCKPIIERLNNFINYSDSTFNGNVCPTFEKSIVVKNLRFAYPNSQPVINDVNFTFDRGKKYAIVGKSGCGKTTLINLLNGYYKFDGDIFYDDINMRDLDIEKLNEMSSVIHQNVYIFDESIKDNICLHKEITLPDLDRALKMSGVNNFLQDKSLSFLVGENGCNLSGGQRQRLAVARALVQKKPILVLDEGTSAIDMQTAYDIESQLFNVNDLTVITITHSLNPELLSKYEKVIFMSDGEILGADSFANLLTDNQEFNEFYNLKQVE